MIKRCPACHKKREMRSNQKYCDEKCKKTWENLQRSSLTPVRKPRMAGKPKVHLLNSPKVKLPVILPDKPIAQLHPNQPERQAILQPTVTPTNPPLAGNITCPTYLNSIAAEYWEKIAPTVIERGHLNILSEDAFAEMCDNYSRLRDVNRAIDETNRNLLQVIDQWDNKKGKEVYQVKESALSDLKRKYSKLFLDYQNRFYLTPLANRGNFGLDDKEEVDPHDAFLGMGK